MPKLEYTENNTPVIRETFKNVFLFFSGCGCKLMESVNEMREIQLAFNASQSLWAPECFFVFDVYNLAAIIA